MSTGYTPIGQIKISYSGPVPHHLKGLLTQRAWNDIIRAAWQPVGDYWASHLHAKHFTQAGGREYGYAPRQGETGNPHPSGFWASYTGQKQKHLGHKDPMVLTGELRDASKCYRVVAKATSKGSEARIVLPRAQKANLMPKHGKISLRDELTTVSEQEVPALVAVFDAEVQRQFFTQFGTRIDVIPGS